MNIDEFNLVPIKDTPFEDSDVNVMIDLDFTEKRYEIQEFGIMDMLSIIGGLNASIGPLLGLLTPFFIINYLY